MNVINYNADNTQTQGAIVSDYLQIGTAVPEPATLGLLGVSGAAILFIRRRFFF